MGGSHIDRQMSYGAKTNDIVRDRAISGKTEAQSADYTDLSRCRWEPADMASFHDAVLVRFW